MSCHLKRWLPLFLLLATGCAPLRTSVDYERGLIAFHKGLYGEAETHLQSSLRQSPKDEKSLSLQGWVFFRIGRMGEAKKYFASASLINPQNISAIEGLAWIDYLEGLNEASEIKFKRMTDYAETHFRNPYWSEYSSEDRLYIHSVHSNANYGLGLIANRMGRLERARQYLEEAINQPNQFIDPDEIRFHLAETLFGLKDYRQALIHYQELLRTHETDFSFLNRYAWCLYQTGKTREAKTVFLKAKSFLSSEVDYYRGSSSVQNMTEKLLAKRMAEAYYGLAIILAKEGNVKEGMKELSTAFSLSPFFHSPDELFMLQNPHPP